MRVAVSDGADGLHQSLLQLCHLGRADVLAAVQIPDLLAKPELDDKALARGIAQRAQLEGFQIGHTKVRSGHAASMPSFATAITLFTAV